MGILEKIFIVVNLVLAVGLCAAMGSNMGALKEEKKNLAEKDLALQAEKDRADAAEDENDRKEDTIAALEVDKIKLTKDLATAKTARAEKVATLTKENERLMHELEDDEIGKRALLADARQTIKTLLADRKDLRKEITDNTKTWTDRNNALSEQNTKLGTDLTKEKRARLAEVTRLNKNIEELKIKIPDEENPTGSGPSGPKIVGKVIGAMPDDLRGGWLLSIRTAANSEEARKGLTLFVFRNSEGEYLGKAKIMEVQKTNEDKSQILIAHLQDPGDEKDVRINDDVSTVLLDDAN